MLVDQVHRSFLSEDIGVYLAESVLRLLDEDPAAKVVLAAHNWHIKKAPARGENGELLYPAGYHLDAALGEDYRSEILYRTGRYLPDIGSVKCPGLTH